MRLAADFIFYFITFCAGGDFLKDITLIVFKNNLINI